MFGCPEGRKQTPLTAVVLPRLPPPPSPRTFCFPSSAHNPDTTPGLQTFPASTALRIQPALSPLRASVFPSVRWELTGTRSLVFWIPSDLLPLFQLLEKSHKKEACGSVKKNFLELFKRLKSILSPKVFPICSLLVKLMKSKNDSDAKQKSATDMPHHFKFKSTRGKISVEK